MARDRDGVLWFYQGTGNPDRPFKARVSLGGGWNQYTSLTAFPNGILARDAAGVLWIYDASIANVGGPLDPRRKYGTGFGSFTALAFGGAKTGAGHADLVARDRAGNLWLYEGMTNVRDDRKTLTGKRTLISGAWNVYTLLI
ncbi:hypothetical protein [Streptomyces sp. NBC_00096]|uniref:hypothetical protein n=1 Tax=Streptomyces sp. NBC_00096 TaxID=2975650 RepID=UPI0032490249